MEKNAIFDNIASFMNEAGSTAKNLGEEIQNIVNGQIEKALNKIDMVKKDEFEVVQDMLSKITSEHEELKSRIAKLEERHTS